MLRNRLFFLLVLLAVLCGCGKTGVSRDELNFAVSYNPDSLDPHRWDNVASLALSSHFYEGLVAVDANQQVHPALAISWETPDVFTWILHVRPHVKFHSGKDLTSRDVIYSFQRVMQDPALGMSVHLRSITEIKALDGMTLQIKTQRPASVLLHKLRLISIVPEGSVAHDLEQKENGTGPYRLVEWKKGEMIRMVRNEEYWGPKPFLRAAGFYLNSSPGRAIEELRSGKAGFIQCNSKEIEKLAATENYRVLHNDSLFVEYIGFNLSQAQPAPNPFLSKPFRQAIQQALDRKALASALSTYALPADQPIPSSVFGYDPRIVLAPPDPIRAKELLSESGWKPDQPAVMHVRPLFQETAALVQKQLAACGIPVKLVQVSETQFSTLHRQGGLQSYLGRYACLTGDSSDLLDDVFSSPDFAGFFNGEEASKYSHPTYTGPKEKETIDPLVHRRMGLQTVIAMFMEDVLLVPLCVDQDAYAIDASYSWQPRYDSLILASEVRGGAKSR